MKLKYFYEANSNVDSIADYVNTTYHQGFAYDNLNRLTNVYSSAGSQTFTYDKTGNRLSKNDTSYYYWTNTDKVQKDQRGDTCWYDSDGNLIKYRNGSTLIDSFAYNWTDQLIYYKKSQEELDFAYNASGLRVKKHYKDNASGNEDTTYYIYDGINPLAEYSSGGSLQAYYIYANGKHIAKIAGADTNWYHCDALGSPRKTTNESGSVIWTGAYYPFGEMITGSGNVHGFTGKELDSETGLNYFCQRYYDPQTGRFTQLDPQDSPAASPYEYCTNNPLKFTDPTGLTKMAEEMEWKMEIMAAWKAGLRGHYGAPSWWYSPTWFLGSAEQLDPGLFERGWWRYTRAEKLNMAVNYLSNTAWGKTEMGAQIINEIRAKIGKGELEIGGSLMGNYDRVSGIIDIGTAGIDYLGLGVAPILVEEVAHALANEREFFGGDTQYDIDAQIEGFGRYHGAQVYGNNFQNFSDPWGFLFSNYYYLYTYGGMDYKSIFYGRK